MLQEWELRNGLAVVGREAVEWDAVPDSSCAWGGTVLALVKGGISGHRPGKAR